MKSNKSLKKYKSLRKKIRRNIKKKKSKKIYNQNGGFIGTMYNIAMLPVNMIAKPLFSKLGDMMNNSNEQKTNNIAPMNNLALDNVSLNSIRLNNGNIGKLKQLGSYGYDNKTLNSYIQQLQHVNV